MQVHVPDLNVDQAGLTTVSIGQVAIGPISVRELVLTNTDVTMSAANALLRNVSVKVTLHVSFSWHVHVGLPDGIPDINVGDTYDLGAIEFSTVVGNVAIPGLNNVHIHIPSLTAQNMAVSAQPLGLQAQNATADRIHAQNVTLPAAGFTLAGLMLGSVQGTALAVPAATVQQATVQHLSGDPIKIPAFTLGSLSLPSAQVPSLTSSAPLDVPANLAARGLKIDAGILQATITITPATVSHVDHLEISGAQANATVGQVVLHDVTLPYDALNITLSQIGIHTVGVPAFTVS